VTRTPPTPRREAFDTYWYFASERQRIFERRVAGEAGPWTTDSILSTYKFCNVFRASDRVSQYLIRNVAYDEEAVTSEDRLFQIVAFRMFSKIETWRGLRTILGRQPVIADLRTERFRRALESVRDLNGRLYTGAFILCASDAYGQPAKHLNHIELFRDMFLRGGLATRVQRAASLGDVYHALHDYPLMGDFMSYQTAIDINYSVLVNFSENDFTRPGPGAVRGLKKVFSDFGDYRPEEVIQWMVDRQETEFRRLGLPFNGLWGRPLHAIDCQGLFCEVDKYCREAIPDLVSARVRIKARFEPTGESIGLFFPPKWGINARLPKHNVLGAGAPSAAAPARQLRDRKTVKLPRDASIDLSLGLGD
jgi:hypothetical protein